MKNTTTGVMYLETRYYDSGKVLAKLCYKQPPAVDAIIAPFDYYLETIGKGGDYDDIDEWANEFGIDSEDIESLIYGDIVDISNYI